MAAGLAHFVPGHELKAVSSTKKSRCPGVPGRTCCGESRPDVCCDTGLRACFPPDATAHLPGAAGTERGATCAGPPEATADARPRPCAPPPAVPTRPAHLLALLLRPSPRTPPRSLLGPRRHPLRQRVPALVVRLAAAAIAAAAHLPDRAHPAAKGRPAPQGPASRSCSLQAGASGRGSPGAGPVGGVTGGRARACVRSCLCAPVSRCVSVFGGVCDRDVHAATLQCGPPVSPWHWGVSGVLLAAHQ